MGENEEEDVRYKEYFIRELQESNKKTNFNFIVDGKPQHGEIAYFLDLLFEFIAPRDTENLYIYHPEKNIYIEDGKTYVKQLGEELIDRKMTKHYTEEIAGHIIRKNYVSRRFLEPNPRYINFRNGVYDLENDELIENNGEHFFLEQIPWDYEPDAEMDKIKDFIEELSHPEDLDTLQEMIGHTMYRKYVGKKAFMMYGATDTGKSTFLRLIEKLLGRESISNESIHDILHGDYASANLYGKLANIYADISDKNLGDESKIKVLTGRDTITARRIYQDTFKFRNYATIIFSANNLPSIDKRFSDAFFNRWVLIKFDNQLSEEEKDPNILDKIVTDKEMSGLINWALEGLKRLIKSGSFSISNTTKEIKKDWILESQPELFFIQNCIKESSGNRMTTAEVYNKFQEWVRDRGLESNISQRSLTQKINEQVMCTYGSMTIEGKVQRGFEGIEIDTDTEMSQREKIKEIQDIIIDVAGGESRGASESEVKEKVEENLGIDPEKINIILKKPIEEGFVSYDEMNEEYFVFEKIGEDRNEQETLQV